MRYEGNPALWHLFLFLITCFTHDPVYMQALHLLIACGFIFVINRYSEIERPYKIMASFGYFTLFEYSVISRSYGLALLLIFIVCALYKNRGALLSLNWDNACITCKCYHLWGNFFNRVFRDFGA